MNYGKLQFSFILLLAMTIILTLTCLFIIKHILFAVTSFLAMLLCISGLVFTIKAEAKTYHPQKNKD